MKLDRNQKIAIFVALVAVAGFFYSGVIADSFTRIASDQTTSALSTERERGTETPSLDIETLEAGDGDRAAPGSFVTVEYTAMFEDGTVVDSSAQYGQAFTFQLGTGQVIPGWDIGLQGMREGGVRRLTVPPGLAYGSQGRGPIPPNTTLVFEIELVEVQSSTQ